MPASQNKYPQMESSTHGKNIAPGSSIEDRVSECFWRMKPERGIKELVRRSDGRTIDWKKMTPDEMARGVHQKHGGQKHDGNGTRSPEAAPEPAPQVERETADEEKIMSTMTPTQPQSAITPSAKPQSDTAPPVAQAETVVIEGRPIEKMPLTGRTFNELTVEGYNGGKRYGARTVTVKCSCGQYKHDVLPSSLTSARPLKSCGHLKGESRKTRKAGDRSARSPYTAKVKRKGGRRKISDGYVNHGRPLEDVQVGQGTKVQVTRLAPVVDFRKTADRVSAVCLFVGTLDAAELDALEAELDRRLAGSDAPLFGDESPVLRSLKRNVAAIREFKIRLNHRK